MATKNYKVTYKSTDGKVEKMYIHGNSQQNAIDNARSIDTVLFVYKCERISHFPNC